ncbi:uncharacterized protein MELLADRAFT_58847 [Melampsora larici-populina 98AG31]|uniref:Uncharacterized protein n=1 Tax=Melampsora larici-populina (strain 98AG31 / pathotype 3-4-7) TaxID=747676 RepID=F4R654_MELLP|nr:uncharacterized protein MELLADRAFT_58847 [Melampsora larici-populina 98AG31]EGG11826.1 hypothetical protein MELLADRAFT_58847 [Melampsora larici-populina 98AG31]
MLPPQEFFNADDNHNAPEEAETNHGSEDDEYTDDVPDYNDQSENQTDNLEPTFEVAPDLTSSYHTTASRKHAICLNDLISKANFISRCVVRSVAWRRHFSGIASIMNLKVLPLTPGYNATCWNTEFDSLNWSVQACKLMISNL